MKPDTSAWGNVTNLEPFTGGARTTIWKGLCNGRAVILRKTSAGEARLRWIERLQKIARTRGLIPNVAIPTSSGALAVQGWTMHRLHNGSVGDDRALRKLVPRIQAMHRATRPWSGQGASVAVHGDLHPGNLLETSEGLILLDWDEARFAHPSVDLAPILNPGGFLHLAHEVEACWHAEPHRARKLARRMASFGYKARSALALTRPRNGH